MDKSGPDAGVALLAHVEDVVHDAVAHVGAGGEGEVAGKTRLLHVLHHGLHRQGGKVGRRTVRLQRLVQGLLPVVVGNAGVHEVDGHLLHADAGAASGLADADDHVGLIFSDALLHGRAAQGEHGGNFQLEDLRPADDVGEQLDGLVGRVDALSAEGIKTCH